MRPRHPALPARRGGKCFGSARRLRIAFPSTAFSPKSDARTRAHSKSPADCGTKHNGRKFAQAAKTFIDSGTDNTDRRARLASATEDATLDIRLASPRLRGGDCLSRRSLRRRWKVRGG